MGNQVLFEKAEKQIVEKQKIVDFDIKEFTIELLINKYINGLGSDENDIFIPEYQREFVWDEDRQSKFIESVLLGLPIPYMLTADTVQKDEETGREESSGRLEVVDGTQRLRTLVYFKQNKLTLRNLEILTDLNGFTYNDLLKSRQKKFLNSTIRMVTLSDKSDDDVRFLMFERINTGSDLLKDMETRKGIYGGKFMDFIYNECSKHPLFRKLTVFTSQATKRGEPQEIIIRFFAFSERYRKISGAVNEFLNEFTNDKNKSFDKTSMYNEFDRMLKFIDHSEPLAFRKTSSSKKTPRVRFDSIAVGVNLALKENTHLKYNNFNWLNSEEYKAIITAGGQNAPTAVKKRIEYVKNKLLQK